MNLIDSSFIPCSISLSLHFSIWRKGQKEEDGHKNSLVKNDADQLLKVSKTRTVSISCVNTNHKSFHCESQNDFIWLSISAISTYHVLAEMVHHQVVIKGMGESNNWTQEKGFISVSVLTLSTDKGLYFNSRNHWCVTFTIL